MNGLSRGNNFDPIFIEGKEFNIDHLKDLQLALSILFDNGDERTITVHMRPTNHLFSRAVAEEDWSKRSTLEGKGAWLKSYVHNDGNYQKIKNTPPALKEHRIFCEDKWSDSFFFPSFVQLLETKPAQTTVLANAGNVKTCLSGIIEVENRPDDVYLVFFTLHKLNSKEVNMLIESAYCVSKTEHDKAKKLLSNKGDKKPFIVVLKNVLEGRLPMESKKKSKRTNKMRKNNKKSS